MLSFIAKKSKRVALFGSSHLSFFDSKVMTYLTIIMASCFIGISAQIKIPLYFTPVPLALTTTAVMLVGALLGSRKGSLATLLYLLQGCAGLPVWAGGISGFAHFMGPTGGYIVGYVAQAFLVGWYMEKNMTIHLPKLIAVLLISIGVQMGIGSLWLAQFVGLQNCLALGFYPFLPTEMAKVIFLALYFKYFRKTSPILHS